MNQLHPSPPAAPSESFSRARRIELIALFGLLTVFTPIAIDMYLPALPTIAREFGTPIAAVLLAVELLLFEWKPRSFVPVAIGAIVAAICRPYLIGVGALFPYAGVPLLPWWGLGLCALIGIVAGLQSALMRDSRVAERW